MEEKFEDAKWFIESHKIENDNDKKKKKKKTTKKTHKTLYRKLKIEQ